MGFRDIIEVEEKVTTEEEQKDEEEDTSTSTSSSSSGGVSASDLDAFSFDGSTGTVDTTPTSDAGDDSGGKATAPDTDGEVNASSSSTTSGGATSNAIKQEQQKQKGGEKSHTVDESAGSSSGSGPDRGTDQDGPGSLSAFLKDARNGLLEASGAKAYARSKDAAELRADMADNEDGTVKGTLQDFDTATKAGLDFLLDNPNASVQEGLQEAAKKPTELATGREVSDEELGESAQDAATKTEDAVRSAIDGTALDNPVTDAVKGGMDVFIADPAKAGLRLATGIDIDEGDTEGTVGAADAFDVGVTVGTAGAGKAGFTAAKGAAKGSDEAATLLSRLLGKQGDEVTSLSQKGVKFSDEGAKATDDVATAADDAVQATDEAAETGEGFIKSMVRTGDEGGKLFDEAAQAGDEATSLTSRLSSGLDEAGSTTKRLLTGKTGKVTAATGAVLTGGAIMESLGTFDSLTLTDPNTGETFALAREKGYQPTNEHPDGGTLWSVRTGNSEDGYTNHKGYTVIVGTAGRNVYILDQNGNRTRAQVPVSTLKEAVQRKRGAGQGGAA